MKRDATSDGVYAVIRISDFALLGRPYVGQKRLLLEGRWR
jgi:hypothetical protein